MLLFRKKYNLPPNDPRLLALTLEEIEVDLEADMAMREGAKPQQCGTCKLWTYFSHCPHCPTHPSLSLLESLVEREERGDTVDWTKEYDEVVWGAHDRGAS